MRVLDERRRLLHRPLAFSPQSTTNDDDDDVSMSSPSPRQRSHSQDSVMADLKDEAGTACRSLFGPTQRGLEDGAKRRGHKKSISGPVIFNEMTLKEEGVEEEEQEEQEDEDQTINTKLAMADLGLMFGSPR